MVEYILALGLLVITLLFISLQKTYYFFPARELKRQARSGDHDAGVLYRAVAYRSSLRLLLWIVIGLTLAGSFALLQVVAPVWLVFIALASLVWYAFAWSPNAAVSRFSARLALVMSPVIARSLYYLHPFLDLVVRGIEKRRLVSFHTGLYERQDLVELITRQRDMADSRISHDELGMVLHALSFGEKTAGSTMVPRHQVMTVGQHDVLGPIVMDELYESAHSRFPVLASDKADIVGTLYLHDIVSARQGGSVEHVMKRDVQYVHEDQTLYHVLHAFFKTKHHLFVVIDSQEVFVGIITIEDVLEQVIGHKIEDEFDSYDDRRAVAGRQAATLQAKPTADTPSDDSAGDGSSLAAGHGDVTVVE